MNDHGTLRCLGCGKSTRVPLRLLQMAEKYKGQPVCFCSRQCNSSWVDKEVRKGQEKQMRSMIERLQRGPSQ